MKFGLTRQAVQLHMRALVDEGHVIAEGAARWRSYHLKETSTARRTFDLSTDITEDRVWDSFVRPELKALSSNDQDICHYGVTEMVNNVIDHSGGSRLDVAIRHTAVSVVIHVRDDGIGMFQKISSALGLSDPRQSLLELSKGKFTTDPRRHTGEGIFFTSRSVDRFTIRSAELAFVHRSNSDDWLVETEDKKFAGTRITMSLLTPAIRTLADVVTRFSSGPEDHRFARTHVPLKLAAFGDETLVSRSSAKRVLSRVDRFEEVFLDFAKVRSIGQGFADEIFRVFANDHPDVRLIAINANEPVTIMIRRAQSAREEST